MLSNWFSHQELLEVRLVKSNYMLTTAAHLAVARVISKSCVSLAVRNATGPVVDPNEVSMSWMETEPYAHPRSLISKMPWGVLKARKEDLAQVAECPESTVRRYIKVRHRKVAKLLMIVMMNQMLQYRKVAI